MSFIENSRATLFKEKSCDMIMLPKCRVAKKHRGSESETPVNLENPNSTKEFYVTNKSAVTKEEKPKTRSRVVLKHQVQKIETSKPESKANITQNIDSESKTEDEKSEQTAGVVKGFSKCVVALRANCLRKG